MTEPSTPYRAAAAIYERFEAHYPSGTVIASLYSGGVPLAEAQTAHPMAQVAAVEDSRVHRVPVEAGL